MLGGLWRNRSNCQLAFQPTSLTINWDVGRERGRKNVILRRRHYVAVELRWFLRDLRYRRDGGDQASVIRFAAMGRAAIAEKCSSLA